MKSRVRLFDPHFQSHSNTSRKPQGKLFLGIHVQHANSGAADRGFAHDIHAPPFKVIVPFVFSRMEQLRDFFGLRINTGQVRPFVQIAIDTREGKIIQIIGAAVDSGNDVFDMESGER